MAGLLTSQTGSIINNAAGNTVDRTGTSLSTNIIIQVNGTPIGAIQTLSINEQANIAMVDEVGTDGHIDSFRSKSVDISGDCQRIRYDLLTITEAFSRDFLHVAAQRIPFDIVIFDQTAGDGANTVITTIQNVWIQKISYAYKSDNFMIVDDMSWVAETIFSTLTSGASAASSGPRGFSLQQNASEVLTDIGVNRGALNAPGLINAVFE
jgi:hypothetical protein